ncbi:MAG: NADH:flavin oxidoreductase/NADH oxidase family protein [Oceanococcus sp.]|nr:MAG: NADH:flavin oxidoreductase/NADH oxidase family protein [Oceanococcus sp.]
MSILATPLTLPCGLSVANRIVKAAMTEGLADAQQHATPELQRLYGWWAQSGAAVLLSGNVQIDHRVLERPGNVVLEDESGLDQLKSWADGVNAQGSQLWMQISHAGRQSFRYVTNEPMGPSAVPVQMMGQIATPRALEEHEILDFIQRWARAARWAEQAGFKGAQVHAAHGYLLSSFLSPLANRRSDRWGGSIENRARFLIETVRAIRKTVSSGFALSVKLNSADFQRGGFGPEDSQAVIAMLNDEGIDLLEISGGNYEQPRLLGVTTHKNVDQAQLERTSQREAYFLRYAEEVRELAQMPLMVTGGFRTRATMEQAIESGVCQMIGLGRPFCVANDFVKPLLDGSLDQLPAPEQQLMQRQGFFSPFSPLKAIQMTYVMGAQGYYYRQLIRIGQGLPVETRIRLLANLMWHYRNELRTAAAVKRARKAKA